MVEHLCYYIGMAASSGAHERITHLKATMVQVRTLQADLLDQITEMERLHIAEQVGYRTTRQLLIGALRVAPRSRPAWSPTPNWSPKR